MAHEHFSQILNTEFTPRWANQRNIRAMKLRAMLDDGTFENQIEADIRNARAMLNLPERSPVLPAN